MASPTDPSEQKHFLDVEDAEIVDGPGVIAEKVSRALKDADRFDVPHVKPPLSEALGRLKHSDTAAAAPERDTADQNAMSGIPAEVDEAAGSAEVLRPAEQADPA